MEHRPHKTLIIACGAIAKEILAIKANMGMGDGVFDLTCLPASYHNFPDKIVPGIEVIIHARGGDYDRILLGYGDCGTGGGLDRMMAKYPKATRLPGAHCYAFYAGVGAFDDMMEEELGSFFLTDYLARHFETLIVKGFGIDRFPDLKETYFKHYNRLVYLSQKSDADLIARAKSAAKYLDLEYIHRPVGYGHLEAQISTLSTDAHHV